MKPLNSYTASAPVAGSTGRQFWSDARATRQSVTVIRQGLGL
jgi:hypothetical protein